MFKPSFTPHRIVAFLDDLQRRESVQPCGLCARLHPAHTSVIIPLHAINSIQALQGTDLLRTPGIDEGVPAVFSPGVTEEGVIVCGPCWSHIGAHRMPKYALAGGWGIRDIPEALQGLTLVEQLMVTRRSHVAHRCIINTNRLGDSCTEITIVPLCDSRRGMIDNVNLPPDPYALSHILQIHFSGGETTMASSVIPCLIVRRQQVECALKWLCSNNPSYRDIIIDARRLALLPECDYPGALVDALKNRQGTARYEHTLIHTDFLLLQTMSLMVIG